MIDNFELKKIIKNYQLTRPRITKIGNEVRQKLLLTLIECGGVGGIRVGDIQKETIYLVLFYTI